MTNNFDNSVFNYSTYDKAGWGERKAFSQEDIEQIGTDLKPGKMPKVAVPSPFARFELMQKAFGNVAKNGESADLRDRNLVSQALDVFQLIFEGTDLGKLEVVEWHLDGATSNLISMGEAVKDKRPGLWLYGTTLRDYASRENYGLRDSDQLNGETTLYMLRHNEDVLGMTCPTSVFMPTPNFEDHIWNEYVIEGGIPVFSLTRDLYERPKDFIVQLYVWFEGLKHSNNNRVPESLELFGKYLVNQIDILSRTNQDVYSLVQDAINGIISLDSYAIAEINGREISVLGFPIYRIQKASISKSIKETSDLLIMSTLKPEARSLVLSNNISNTKWIYTSDTTYWDSKNSGLDYSDRALWQTDYKRRKTLPNGIEYDEGFVSEHDFLSDQLWKLPYNLDERFEKIRVSDEPEGCSFLAPVTPLYFEFFTKDDLKKALQLQVKNNSSGEIVCVTAILDIPVKGGTVKLKKVYWPSETMQEVVSENLSTDSDPKGFIIETPLALSIFPFIRFNEPEMCEYAMQLVREKNWEMTTEFEMSLLNLSNGRYIKYDTESSLKLRKSRRRVEDGQTTVQSYSLAGAYFDIVRLDLTAENFQSTAYLIPVWGEQYIGGNKSLTFAFDFGTSNTYVAVADEKEEFKLPMNLLATTISDDSGREQGDVFINSCYSYVEQELLPYSRASKPFPIASVLSKPKVDYNGEGGEEKVFGIPFLRNSIPFVYGYEDYGSSVNEILSNLKWEFSKKDRDSEDKKHVPAFINELMMLARAYAVEKKANLEKCKIVWTYPLSMPDKSLKDWEELWLEAYKHNFNSSVSTRDEAVVSLPESVAPMLCNGRDIEGVGLSIDVGGGTCDVVIYDEQDTDWKISSFRFGAETIFGIEDVITEDIPMIAAALKDIKATLKKCQAGNPSNKAILENIANNLPDENTKVSETTRALFALSDLDAITRFDLSDSVSFNKWLQKHDEYHYIFYYYYAAIIYYITQMMIAADYEEAPENIYFSGSGSKILNIISKGKNRILCDLTADMISSFAPDLELEEIQVVMEKEPKKVTAHGALSQAKEKDKFTDFEKAKKYQLKFFLIEDVDGSDKPKLKCGVLKEKLEECVDSMIHFNKMFESFIDKYAEEYDIDQDSVKVFLDSMKKNGEWNQLRLKKMIRKGLELKYKGDDEEYPDAPFFAGIKRAIYKELKKKDDDD